MMTSPALATGKTVYSVNFLKWPKMLALTLANDRPHYHALNQIIECMVLKSIVVFIRRSTKILAAPFDSRAEKAFDSSMRTAVPLFGLTAPNVHES